MSSTNRSKAREKHIADYYVTPVPKIAEFLTELSMDESIDWKKSIILDPCAGGDAYHPMSYPEAISNVFGVDNVKTVDIREDSLAEVKADYLTMSLDYQPDIIITNPPFNLAIEIIKKALSDVRDGGYVIMLLRLNFLETKSRKLFFDGNMPKYIYVHSQRMCFTDTGGTDSVAYAHYVFQKGCTPKFSKLRII